MLNSHIKKHIVLILISLLINSFNSIGQSYQYGRPFIRNYNKEDFKASDQNNCIVQGRNGKMYFGNNYGVLEFDGIEWSLIAQTTNRTAITALCVDLEGTIYVGSVGEFGCIKSSLNGQKYYVPLTDKIPAQNQKIGAIREIYETSSGISFISRFKIFTYSNDSISVIAHTSDFVSFSKISDSILIQDKSHNLFVIKDKSFRQVCDNVQFDGEYMKKIFSEKDGELLFYSPSDKFSHLHDNKIIPIDTKLNNYLIDNEAVCFKQLRGGYIAIGTSKNGIIIIDEKKNPVQLINKEHGLQNNKILAIETDDIGNLWVSTVGGIDYVELTSPFSKVNEFNNIQGSVFSICESNNELYVGTNAGLLWANWNTNDDVASSKLDFKIIPKINGQVWEIKKIDDYLYASTNRGLLKINKSKSIERIGNDSIGSWTLKLLNPGSDLYIQGGYRGLKIFKKLDNGLKFITKVRGFNETSRVIEVEKDGTIWMAHGYKGIYKLKLSETLDSVVNISFYNKDKGFPTSLFINMYKIKDEIVFGTEYGVYHYLSKEDTMVIHPFYKESIGVDKHIRLLKEVGNDILYVKGKDMYEEIGIIEIYGDGRFNVIKTPFQKLKGMFVPGFDNVTITKLGNLLFGAENGMIFYNRKNARDYNKRYFTNISKLICATNDSLVYGDYDGDDTTNVGSIKKDISLPYNLNSLEVRYAAAFFESIKEIKYSYFLEGFDSKWSAWSSYNQKKYDNLKKGKYVFHVKARNIYGLESEEDSIAFEIQPPWYRTIWAYLAYSILALLFILLLIRQFKTLLEKEKQRIIAKELLEKRAEINKHLHVELSTEKELRQILEERNGKDIEDKNVQLAVSTMHLIQMNDTITQIKDELDCALQNLDSNKRGMFKNLINFIDQKAQKNESWETFELHFNKVHNDFLRRLKLEYPDLSHRDLRLCAYLRLNLASKELAKLMGISVRGIESLRYRVRKKLDLNTDDNLTEYLLNY